MLGCTVQMMKAKEERRNTYLLQIFYNSFYLSPERFYTFSLFTAIHLNISVSWVTGTLTIKPDPESPFQVTTHEIKPLPFHLEQSNSK